MTARCSWYAVHGPNGDLTWRVTGPADVLGAKLNLVPEAEGEDVGWPNSGPFFPWQIHATEEDGTSHVLATREAWQKFIGKPRRLTGIETAYPEHEGDAAVFARPMSWLTTHGLELRRQGVRVVAELDDNYLSPSRMNVMFELGKTSEKQRDEHARCVCSTDAIIVSTEYLRDQYVRELKRRFPREPIPEIHVCRNHVHERQIPAVPDYDGPLRVGFMGSDSHVWDVDLIYPALAVAKERGCQIVFVGIHPQHVNPRYRRKNWDWAALEYEHVPWRIDYQGIPLPIDIGLAPLVVNSHTLCKSDIKALEYAMSGAACVAQNCLVYNRTLTSEHVLFAGSPAEFAAQTVRLIDDAKLRRDLAANTMRYIRDERMLTDHKDEWETAIYG